MIELLTSVDAWLSLLVLVIMEIVLGIDNIIFISIIVNKVPRKKQARVRNSGLFLAMILRILLLFGITVITEMQKPLFELKIFGKEAAFTGQSLILIIGGLFLLYKSVREIHHKLEGKVEQQQKVNSNPATLNRIIIQIALLNIVFSFDSILTAVGLTREVALSGLNPLPVMIAGVIISMLLMMAFAGPIGNYVNDHPTIQMLGLSFLILIGFMLIAEGAHAAKITKGEIPEGYVYFAMLFSLSVEILNIRNSKNKKKPVQLYDAEKEVEDDEALNKGKKGK